MVKTVKGTLPVGVEYKGAVHREFELRRATVRDNLDILSGPDKARASEDNAYAAVCLWAKRIVRLGDIPAEAITPELVLDLSLEDFAALEKAGAQFSQAS